MVAHEMIQMSFQKSRKAQSGMEYLMTYGWAILVVGIIILLLMSLKVFDMNFVNSNNEVYMLSSFNVPDFKATPYAPAPDQRTVLIFQLINNRGTNVTIWDITVRDPNNADHTIGTGGGEGILVWYCPTPSSCSCVAKAFPFNMTPGQRMIVNGTIEIPGEINTVFTTKIEIKYSSPRSLVNHTEAGMVRGRVETP